MRWIRRVEGEGMIMKRNEDVVLMFKGETCTVVWRQACWRILCWIG